MRSRFPLSYRLALVKSPLVWILTPGATSEDSLTLAADWPSISGYKESKG